MIRKLAIALTLVSAGLASHVQALGLGGAKVNSNLNQPLVAEIDLVNTGALSESEILPGLATREEFLKAGIDRVYFLSDIRFEVKAGADGQPKIVLTTRKPVREPFLNFLVEVIWPSGRLLREYALLIDPPVFAEDKPIAAAPASVSQEAPATAAQAPSSSAPVVRETGDRVNVQSSVAPAKGALAGNETYGPTQRSDTLWEIATAVRPDKSVSPQQVMLAIQDLNPDAFIDNNINKLKAGQILRLPTKEQAQSRTGYEAINAVIEQNAALRKPKTKTPTSAASKSSASAPKKAAASDDELKLVVPEKDSKASDAASSDPSGSAASGTASAEELSLTLEQLDKAKLENDELSGKVNDLEEQLETLQRILTLKNDQLANLQSQMRASELESAESAVEEDGIAQLEGESSMDTGSSDDAMTEEAEGAAEAESSELTEVVVSETVTDAKLVDGEGNVVAEQVIVEETVVQKPVSAQPKQESKPLQDQIFDQIMSNPLYQLAVAGGLILLLILLWVISKSRAKQEVGADEDYEEEYAEENEFEEVSEEFSEEFSEEADADEEEYEASESTSEEGQEDVIAEADVYIAYGRLDQAATILEQGISADPVRVDYRLKLLEVYKDALQEDAFAKQISELEAIQDQDALARAAEIREELAQKLKDKDAADAADQGADFDHLLDEDEEQELLGGDEGVNNFDFDTVDDSAVEELADDVVSEAQESDDAIAELDQYAEEAMDEVGDEVDFDSDELDVDLDINLDLDDAAADISNELEEDPGIDFESVDFTSDNDELSNDADVSDEERADLELDDALSLDDAELDSETEIDLDLSDELELAEDDLSAVDLGEDGLDLDEESVGADDLSLELDGESGDVDDLSLELDEEVDLGGDDLALEVDEFELEDAADDVLTEDEAASLDLSEDLELESDSEPSDAEDLLLDVGSEVDEAAAGDLELDESDVLDITDETLDEAAAALGDADDFEPELSEDEDFDFLEGTDEASTKLDLARAYIDMGDADGAKEILLEVESEGSPEQQKQARELIDSLEK